MTENPHKDHKGQVMEVLFEKAWDEGYQAGCKDAEAEIADRKKSQGILFDEMEQAYSKALKDVGTYFNTKSKWNGIAHVFQSEIDSLLCGEKPEGM